jgi:ornithine cyclodeaminase/alanine dehydrogenase-like protein (mu-crystallin family)
MKIIDAEITRRALPFDRLIPALKDMFIAGCEVPLRHTHTLSASAGSTGTVLIMPAWQPGGFLGIKTVTIAPGNSSRGLPGLFSIYVLYDAQTGEPLAQIDGNEITSRRTAAASALAASYMARPDARTLLIVGAGRVGSLLAEAYRTVLPIERVTVWDCNPAAAESLANRLQTQGIDAEAAAAADLDQAAGRADVVSCATLATQPIVRGAWLHPHSHLDLIGSFTPQMREADDACFVGARVLIDTEEAVQKSGDLLGPMARGVVTAGSISGTLADLARGTVFGRCADTGRTVFKSVGTALEDLAASVLVFQCVTSH